MSRERKSLLMILQVPAEIQEAAAWNRLTDQLDWYDAKSVYCQRRHKWLRGFQVALAVSIPITGRLGDPLGQWATAVSGAVIAILEAVQHMNQYSTLWVIYRATAENLKHEKYLFLSEAGPYKGLQPGDRLVCLAERVEEHVSVEHGNWFNETRLTATQTTRKT